jgi:cyclase
MKTRLVAMVTVLDGIVVQSFSYKKYLPIGSPELICENLSRWGADEIIISFIDIHYKKMCLSFLSFNQ